MLIASFQIKILAKIRKTFGLRTWILWFVHQEFMDMFYKSLWQFYFQTLLYIGFFLFFHLFRSAFHKSRWKSSCVQSSYDSTASSNPSAWSSTATSATPTTSAASSRSHFLTGAQIHDYVMLSSPTFAHVGLMTEIAK